VAARSAESARTRPWSHPRPSHRGTGARSALHSIGAGPGAESPRCPCSPKGRGAVIGPDPLHLSGGEFIDRAMSGNASRGARGWLSFSPCGSRPPAPRAPSRPAHRSTYGSVRPDDVWDHGRCRSPRGMGLRQWCGASDRRPAPSCRATRPSGRSPDRQIDRAFSDRSSVGHDPNAGP
jgi:hypothetical protein